MIFDYSKGLLFIFLAVLCNFTADTMNCSIQRALSSNLFVKWIVVMGLIYFTVNFTSDANIYPTKLLFKSFLVFILFMLFMKQHKITFYISLILLISIFTLNNYVDYYTLQNDNKKVLSLQKALFVLQIILISTLIIGNLVYMHQQYNDHLINKDFSLIRFYFGVNKCSNLAK